MTPRFQYLFDIFLDAGYKAQQISQGILNTGIDQFPSGLFSIAKPVRMAPERVPMENGGELGITNNEKIIFQDAFAFPEDKACKRQALRLCKLITH
ncbi:hypothetical protein [Pedobacter ginsenosidimutans]|uniref:hypothetical protein n=1 Tax=Pedobacter ginsenosidimutans TaxID=687842 RepID=UPI0012FB230F|nr:hypothetical protein [Pedobacter ginsenosidimutans]